MIYGVSIPGMKLHRVPLAELDLGRSGRLSLHSNFGGGKYIVHQHCRHFRWIRVEPPKDGLLAFLAGWWPNRPSNWWDGEYGAADHDSVVEPKRRRTFAYFIGGDVGPIKIGIAESPLARLRILQTSYPYTLKILATVEGDRHLERDFHERFGRHRLRGEWFERDEEIIDAIHEITG